MEKLYPKDSEARAMVDQVLYIEESAIDAMYQYSVCFVKLEIHRK